jgi:ABC-type glycerol-3-phosphate transport system substrate-binding protein
MREEYQMKKFSIKFVGCIVAVTVVITSMLSGCGGAAKQPSTKTQSTTASAAKGTITYWSHNNEAFVDANKKLIDDFKKVNPKIKINYQNFPYDVTMQKMKASYAAKNEADIIQVFGAWMPAYLKQGVIAEVPASLSSDYGTKFYEGAVAGYMKDGKYYGIPRETNVEYGLFYVPDKMKAAGLNGAPKTFDELVNAAKASAKFTNNSLQYGGLEFYNYDNCTFLLLSWIKQQGGDYWTEDGKHIKLETAQAEKAWQRMIDLVNVDKVTDVKHITAQVATEQYFFSKKAAMLVKGPWAAAEGDSLKNSDWAFAAVPPFSGDKSTFVVEPGWGEVVSARSKNPDAVWEFLGFASSLENSKYWNLTTGTIPSEKAIAEDQAFITTGNNGRIKEAFGMLQNSVPMGPVQDSDFLKQTILDTFLRSAEGKVDTKGALKFVQDEVNKHIDQLLAQ